jgi:N-methylhydantoinase B/oxoprolinase/acetone carboxylase alpha subunit
MRELRKHYDEDKVFAYFTKLVESGDRIMVATEKTMKKFKIYSNTTIDKLRRRQELKRKINESND